MSTRNRLANETSPYLLQHADNPVDWYPWNQEALDTARRENKPILLSIGYAACHWCHVMAHESFADPDTAKLMNQWFINIKVDREERPDLDKIYQTTHYLLTQRGGGWPLTTFLTPEDLTPFFSGTYFPPEPRHGIPPFREILQKIVEIYRDRQADIQLQNTSLQRVVRQPGKPGDTVTLTLDPVENAITAIEASYDTQYGGFGDAPKFPQTHILRFLAREKSTMALHSLFNMAKGGIYDQLGGGFYRYAVDARWEIPHFEKMLYDNAGLLSLYAELAGEFKEPYFEDVARETGHWVMAAMQAPEGGYYSSLDADIDGEEGKYYLWQRDDIQQCVSGEEYQMLKIYFGLDEAPNFEGQWHLHIVEALLTPHEKTVLANARQKLLAARERRPHPHRDEKIVTAWNALMIQAMLIAGHHLQERAFIESAQTALKFIRAHLWKNQRLLACYAQGKATLPAYLDDYAFLLQALLTSYRFFQKAADLDFAKQIADTLLTHFYDAEAGGFYFTADDHETLLYRPKSLMDESLPSGNGVAVSALIELGRLTQESRYLAAAEKTLMLAWPMLVEHPVEHCSLLLGLKSWLS